MYKFIAALAVLLAGFAPAQAQMAVVAHPGVSDASVDKGTLISIYSLEKVKWSDGKAVLPIDVKDDAVADAFYTALGRDAGQFKKVWMRKKLAGEGQPPQTVGTAAEVLAKVAATPGAVGFVPASAVTGNVKVLAKL